MVFATATCILVVVANNILDRKKYAQASELQSAIKRGMTVQDVLRTTDAFKRYRPTVVSVQPNRLWQTTNRRFRGQRGTIVYFSSSWRGWLCINEVAVVINYTIAQHQLRVINAQIEPAWTCV